MHTVSSALTGDRNCSNSLQRNSRAHYNLGLRFNANSVLALFTEKPTLGVSLIKNVAFENPRYEIPWTLWCNTTLGLLCHWVHSNKQQQGRGMLSQLTLYTLPTLDVQVSLCGSVDKCGADF